MQKVNHPQDKWWNAVFILTGLLIVAVDQLSKTWIRANLARGQSLFEAGFFRISHVHNTGAAFGLLRDQSLVLTILGVVAVVALLICSRFSHRSIPFLGGLLGKFALGLVLGGTIGNLIDRLRFGYVTDFIDFNLWPAFNVADAAITIGVIIFAFTILRTAQFSES